MKGNTRYNGFSLMETLLAVGTLAIGLTFIAGTFLTGIYFSTVSTERTIAAVAAEEAFAKLRLFRLAPNASLTTGTFVPYEQLTPLPAQKLAQESLYPSTLMEDTGQQYSWAALCRKVSDSSDLVQCTVFVSRATGSRSTYWVRQSGVPWPQPLEPSDLPRPVRISVTQDAASAGTDVISIVDAIPGDNINELAFVNDGAVLVHDNTGQIYRVLERSADQPDKVRLDRPWGGGTAGYVWVVPPATSGGRNPMIAVYQEVIKFSQN